ncbi:hypothetical protein CONLIGDRAFT_81010 [Coniochaeta ligniaria NRRL 30616]|uniref:Uncharacterized protein n=1 Tax=Coniochaeta ligniaria NRRL 30616 TaxID=1408157 RepID=A0A1J7ICQ8_9PEZI|nr:hypothetical protein CONLIGDRAFT_81010 [Coniochaeta ligniaria NRRL 30616]
MEIVLAATDKKPKLLAHRDIMTGSYARPPVVGSSIGLGGNMKSTGTIYGCMGRTPPDPMLQSPTLCLRGRLGSPGLRRHGQAALDDMGWSQHGAFRRPALLRPQRHRVRHPHPDCLGRHRGDSG